MTITTSSTTRMADRVLLILATCCAVLGRSSTAFQPSPQRARQRQQLFVEKNGFWRSVSGLWEEVIEMSTYGPSERRILKARRLASAQEAVDDDLSLENFHNVVAASQQDNDNNQEPPDFDGYALRDLLVEKWKAPLDVDFQRASPSVVYCTVMPVAFGSTKCRHESELSYLMHLQGIVEILHKYDNLDLFVNYIVSTNKEPKPGTDSVPFRMELSEEDLEKIMG